MIPERLHASSAVAHGEQHEGELALKLLPRLAASLANANGRLQVRLRASDSTGYPALSGRIQGALPLHCKRCGKPFDWALDLPVDLRLVTSEGEEKQALVDSEPYLVEHGELPLREIVEDEVLLALPMLPRCAACENEVTGAPAADAPDAPAEAGPRRENPFAALKKQLKLKK